MDVSFVPPDLRRLDAVRADALALPVPADERPLRGAVGLVDWRLCGWISRMMLRDRIRGARGERVLLPARPRFSFEKIVLYGTGDAGALDERAYVAVLEGLFEGLAEMQVHSTAIALPGRSGGAVPPERAMQLFLEVAAVHGPHDEFVLVEPHDAQKAMAPILELRKG